MTVAEAVGRPAGIFGQVSKVVSGQVLHFFTTGGLSSSEPEPEPEPMAGMAVGYTPPLGLAMPVEAPMVQEEVVVAVMKPPSWVDERSGFAHT